MNVPDLASCDDDKETEINLTDITGTLHTTAFTKPARKIFIIKETDEPKPEVIIIWEDKVNFHWNKHIVYPKKSSAPVEADKTSLENANSGSQEMKQREIYIVRQRDELSPIIKSITRDQIDQYKNEHIVYPKRGIQEPYDSLYTLAVTTALGVMTYSVYLAIWQMIQEDSQTFGVYFMLPPVAFIILIICCVPLLVLLVVIIVDIWMVIRLIKMHKLVRMELSKQFRYILNGLGKIVKSKSK